MRFDIDNIDLLSVFLGWLWIFFCSFMLLIVGLLTGITWITSIGFGIFIGLIVFGLMIVFWIGILLIYDGLKWCF
jgi:hypothetical protein